MIAFLGAAAVIVIALIPIIAGMEAFGSIPEAQQAYAAEGNMFLTAIYLTAGLLVLAVAAALLLSLFQVLKNPKGAIRSLISFGVLLVLFFVFFSMADGTAAGSLGDTLAKFNISDTVSKFIGAGIRLTLLLGLGSVFLIVAMEIWNYIKSH